MRYIIFKMAMFYQDLCNRVSNYFMIFKSLWRFLIELEEQNTAVLLKKLRI